MPQAPICGAVAQLGEHLLCKQGVNGSIPFSSTKTHSLFPDRRQFEGIIQSDADLETGGSGLRIGLIGFYTTSGWAVRETDETVWMFDNEIDWVIAHRALVYRTGRREVAGGPCDDDANTRPSTL